MISIFLMLLMMKDAAGPCDCMLEYGEVGIVGGNYYLPSGPPQKYLRFYCDGNMLQKGILKSGAPNAVINGQKVSDLMATLIKNFFPKKRFISLENGPTFYHGGYSYLFILQDGEEYLILCKALPEKGHWANL